MTHGDTPRERGNALTPQQSYLLNMACRGLVDAFGPNIFQVGSSMRQRDYRDVDVRCILDDEEFEKLFPGCAERPHGNPLWKVLCVSISDHLSRITGLLIDFQFQQRTQANTEFAGGIRSALGVM